jgi:hypothetical protein
VTLAGRQQSADGPLLQLVAGRVARPANGARREIAEPPQRLAVHVLISARTSAHRLSTVSGDQAWPSQTLPEDRAARRRRGRAGQCQSAGQQGVRPQALAATRLSGSPRCARRPCSAAVNLATGTPLQHDTES